ncbi:uncharacterized protein LOC125316450 [Rhodamnia argentea]|uniref:Uncharacterized protein LOC125316450 n=1 Tax=Rhodamnia argentea TaxID=178133 RepID=A0ABM3HVX2_9MYRT|nr:uncharacterized protein LOC125316450 [Rhodamnia argentea]
MIIYISCKNESPDDSYVLRRSASVLISLSAISVGVPRQSEGQQGKPALPPPGRQRSGPPGRALLASAAGLKRRSLVLQSSSRGGGFGGHCRTSFPQKMPCGSSERRSEKGRESTIDEIEDVVVIGARGRRRRRGCGGVVVGEGEVAERERVSVVVVEGNLRRIGVDGLFLPRWSDEFGGFSERKRGEGSVIVFWLERERERERERGRSERRWRGGMSDL